MNDYVIALVAQSYTSAFIVVLNVDVLLSLHVIASRSIGVPSCLREYASA